MITTSIIPTEWNITCIAGDRLPPLAFKVVYFDDTDCEEYTPVWHIKRQLNKADVLTIEGDKFLRLLAVTKVNLAVNDLLGKYRNSLQITLPNNWLFTIANGLFYVASPIEINGATIGLTQLTFKIPVIKDVNGNHILVDANGDPVLDANGDFITTNE